MGDKYATPHTDATTPVGDGATLPNHLVTEYLEVLSAEEIELPQRHVTPLPVGQITVLVIILLTESLSAMMLLPFVGLFVAHLMGWSNENAGYLSGVLVGAFMLGQVISSKFWGYLSDKYGRKIPLIVGLIVGAAMMLLFGLSPNFYVACITRLIHGFFNGTILIAKTVVSDITDSTNEAKGFALVSLAWGVGGLLGPTLGGFLYDPVYNQKLQWLNLSAGGFFEHNPAFLPGLLISLYMFGAWVVTLVFLKETNASSRSLRSLCPSCCRSAAAGEESEDTCEPTRQFSPLHGNLPDSPISKPAAETVVSTTEEPKQKTLTYADAFRIPSSRYLILIYMLFSAAEMAYSEILPLWAIAVPAVGGLGVASDKVAILILVCGIPSIIANLCFHKVCSLFSDKMAMWRWSIAIYGIPAVLVPCGGLMREDVGYWFVLALGLVRQVGISWCFGLCALLVPRVSPPGNVGAMYGINQAAGSLTRCVVPFAAAPLFAWSISSTNHHFPYDHFLLFIISGVLALITFILSFFLHLPTDITQGHNEASGEGVDNSDKQL